MYTPPFRSRGIQGNRPFNRHRTSFIVLSARGSSGLHKSIIYICRTLSINISGKQAGKNILCFFVLPPKVQKSGCNSGCKMVANKLFLITTKDNKTQHCCHPKTPETLGRVRKNSQSLAALGVLLWQRMKDSNPVKNPLKPLEILGFLVGW